jgi:hypothetical protein
MVGRSGPRGKHDDQLDAFAYLGLTIDQFFEAQTDEEMAEEEYEDELDTYFDFGRNAVTGY